MANFVDDFRNLLINDPSIVAHFGNNILYQKLPLEFDMDEDWLRWTIEDADQTFYAGQAQPARSTYVVIIDILGPDPNAIPRTTDWVQNTLVSDQKYGNIKVRYAAGKDYGYYEDKDLTVGILTLRVVYVN